MRYKYQHLKSVWCALELKGPRCTVRALRVPTISFYYQRTSGKGLGWAFMISAARNILLHAFWQTHVCVLYWEYTKNKNYWFMEYTYVEHIRYCQTFLWKCCSDSYSQREYEFHLFQVVGNNWCFLSFIVLDILWSMLLHMCGSDLLFPDF